MSKEKAGLVKAHCPGMGVGGKPKYLTMGAMFKDSVTGKFSIKIDMIPAVGTNWSGWCNVFEETEIDRRQQSGQANAKPAGVRSNFRDFPEDDIPF